MKGATLNLGVINSVDSNWVGQIQGLAEYFWHNQLVCGMVLPTPSSALKFGASFDYLELHNKVPVTNTGCDSS